MQLKISELPLGGARLLEGFLHTDERGRFCKFFEHELCDELKFETKEVLMSVSRKDVIRGMHFQKPLPQAKVVWCLNGRIYDVFVDLRKKSGTYKKWHGIELSADNMRGVYIPRGFAHGFLALEDNSQVLYLADERYNPTGDWGIVYNDPAIGIKWPLAGRQPVLSKKDAGLPVFSEKEHVF